MQDEHSERGCTEYQESLKEEKRPSKKAVQASFEGRFCALPLRMLCAEVPLEVEFNEIFFIFSSVRVTRIITSISEFSL